MLCALVLSIGMRPARAQVIALPMLQPGFPGDATADAVLGQINLVNNAENFVDGRGLNLSVSINIGVGSISGYGDVAIDKSVNPNRVFVTDIANSRVLGWSSISAFLAHAPANLVIGQPNFNSYNCNTLGVGAASLCHPRGIAVDSAGRLYVADWGNNRVLEYNSPFTTDTIADDVFGQLGLFTTALCDNTPPGLHRGPLPANADYLCGPAGVATDGAGNVYVADQFNHRVLVYYTPEAITAVKGSGDTSADQVFGQEGSFNGDSPNNGGISSHSLDEPQGVVVDATRGVYIADTGNNRVLGFGPSFTVCGFGWHCANHVFGQGGDFTTQACNKGGAVSADSLCTPLRVAADGVGNLYAADLGNNRVLEYNTPLAAGGNTTADRVFGQGGSMSAASCNNGGLSAKGLCSPAAVAVDSASPNNLYVADAANNRVLMFTNPIGTDTVADGVGGQVLFTMGAANFIDGQGFDFSGFTGEGTVAIDRSVSPNRVYVADSGNNRVLAWSDVAAFKTHAPAQKVFGQPNFFVNAFNNGGIMANTLHAPRGVAVDGAGNLYVADTDNNRVLEYNTPFIKTAVAGSGDTVADRVFGQAGFTAGFCNRLIGTPAANLLCLPHGVAVDGTGRLYIGDFGNDRVLEFDKPLSNGPMLCTGPGRCANRVFGQGGSFTMFTINNGGESASSLWNPWGVALDRSNRLYVADFSNHRVLEYDTPLTSATATRVFGQSGFGGPTNCNQGMPEPTAATLCYPRWLTVDGQGNLYVSDTSNNRVLKYVNPLTNAIAGLIIGQGGPFEFNLTNCNLGPNGLCVPEGIAADAANNLYVADMSNYRVLEYYVP